MSFNIVLFRSTTYLHCHLQVITLQFIYLRVGSVLRSLYEKGLFRCIQHNIYKVYNDRICSAVPSMSAYLLTFVGVYLWFWFVRCIANSAWCVLGNYCASISRVMYAGLAHISNGLQVKVMTFRGLPIEYVQLCPKQIAPTFPSDLLSTQKSAKFTSRQACSEITLWTSLAQMQPSERSTSTLSPVLQEPDLLQ